MPGKNVGKKYINTDDLTLSPNNARKDINEKALERLTTSISSFNEVLSPLIVNTKNQIVAGQRRWKAAKEAGIPKIFCTVKKCMHAGKRVVRTVNNSQVF